MKYRKTSAVLLCAFCLLLTACSKVNDNIENASSEAVPAGATITQYQPTETTVTTVTTTETTTEATTVTTYASYEDIPTDFDKTFFENDLFIGDSITTGFSGYGYISEENVFAKVGLNPISVLTTPITTPDGDVMINDEIAARSPERVYIMLGSNGIEWLDNDKMLSSLDELIKLINDTDSDTTVVVLSVPPVTQECESKSDTADLNKKISDYNSSLSTYCSEKNIAYIDISTMLCDENGYFAEQLAESDGRHFKGESYKYVLSLIQRTFDSNEQ